MIRPKEDQLDVRLSQRVGWASPPAEGAAYGLMAAAFLGWLGAFVTNGIGIGVAVFVLALLAAVPLIVYADGAWREKKLRELESLAHRVLSIVATPSSESEPQAARTADLRAESDLSNTEAEAVRIEPPASEGAEELPRARTCSRRRRA